MLLASSHQIAPGRTPTPHLIQGKSASINSSAPLFRWMIRELVVKDLWNLAWKSIENDAMLPRFQGLRWTLKYLT